jgi:catechol 2,3-dioxygenase
MRLGHIHLKVNNLKAAEEFYCKILGLKLQERVHDLALQQVNGSAPRHRDSPENSSGLYHTAFEVHSTEELSSVIEKLKANSFEYTLVDHRISWAVYTQDPSGNGVEIYLDRRNAPRGGRVWGGFSKRLSEI